MSTLQHDMAAMPDTTASVTDTESIRVWLERVLQNQQELLNQSIKHQSTLLAEFDNSFAALSSGNHRDRPSTPVPEREETLQEATATPEVTMLCGDVAALPENANDHAALPEESGDHAALPEKNVSRKSSFSIGFTASAPYLRAFITQVQTSTPSQLSMIKSTSLKVSQFIVGAVYIGRTFEVVSIFLILFNLVVMAAERQWYGMRTGYEIGFYNESPHRYWFHPSYFEVINACMFTFFVLELVFRIVSATAVGAKLLSRSVVWIILDAIFLSLEAAVLLANLLGGHIVDIRPSLLRVLRLLRLVRLLKLFREIEMLDSLFLLIRAIQASLNALFWSFLVLFLMQVTVGLIFSEGFDSYVKDSPDARETRHKLFEYFGTFSRALITMFEISLGNWVPTCRYLMERVSEKFMIFFLVYRCMLCFAMVRVITAVFIAETNRMLADDEDLEVRKKIKARKKNEARMERLFPIMTDEDGVSVTQRGLANALKHESIKQRLAALDIAAHDLDALFQILDDIDKDNGDGVVQLQDFIKGMSLIKGPARSLDVMYLRKQMNGIEEALADISNRLNGSQLEASRATPHTTTV